MHLYEFPICFLLCSSPSKGSGGEREASTPAGGPSRSEARGVGASTISGTQEKPSTSRSRPPNSSKTSDEASSSTTTTTSQSRYSKKQKLDDHLKSAEVPGTSTSSAASSSSSAGAGSPKVTKKKSKKSASAQSSPGDDPSSSMESSEEYEDSGNESSGEDVEFAMEREERGPSERTADEDYPFTVLSTEAIVQHMIDSIREVRILSLLSLNIPYWRRVSHI